MKYVQLLYHYQINSLNLFVKDITAFIEIHQFICFLQAFKQWGLIKQNHSGDITYTINFPISFSNNCFAGLAKNYNATEDTWTGGTGGDVIQSISASQMVYKSGFDLTATGAVYFAVGV